MIAPNLQKRKKSKSKLRKRKAQLLDKMRLDKRFKKIFET